MRRQTRTSCAPAAAALPPWPQAAAAVLNRQRARHKAASFMRNRPTPSGSPESPRAAGRSPRLQTSGRPGAQRTRSELSAVRCRRRGESAQVPPRILRPVGGTCAAAAACAPDCSGRWSAGQGRGTAAGCACAEARRAQHPPAGCGGAAGSPRGPSQIHAPRLHAARGALPHGAYFGLRNRPGSAAEKSARRRLSRPRAGAEWRRPPSPTGTGRLRRRRSA